MDLDSSSPSPSSPPKQPSSTQNQQTSTTITPSDRINELNQIDLSISTLLSSASTATSILANNSTTTSSTPSSASPSLSTSKSQFTNAVQTYFSTLSSIEVRLRRQIYALEEAGLISTGTERDTRRGRVLNSGGGGGDDDLSALVSGGRKGGGPLDPSWLNARGSDAVEVQKKKEILEAGVELVKKMRSEGGVLDGKKKDDDGREMEM